MRNKKRFLTAFAGICMAFAVTSFTGCGSKDEEPSSGVVSNKGEDGEPTPTTAKLLSSDNKRFSKVEEYIEAQKSEIDTMLKQYEDSGMTMKIFADGDTLVYHYIYDEQIGVTQAMLDYFDSSISDYRKQFDSVISEMERLIDIEKPAVELRYENPDGSLIYSCVLTKDDEIPTYGEVTDSSESEKFASMEEYVDSQKEIFDQTLKQLEGSGMSMEIYAEGNTLVYRYTYETPVEVTEENIALMESSLEASKAQFQSLITQMETLIDADDIAIKILYENPDGSEVYSCIITK